MGWLYTWGGSKRSCGTVQADQESRAYRQAIDEHCRPKSVCWEPRHIINHPSMRTETSLIEVLSWPIIHVESRAQL